MPEGTYTMLKPTNGRPNFESYDKGAHYYAYGPSNSVSKYKKISGTIILPSSLKLVGTGNGRNAFISLGLATVGDQGIDIGIRNRGLDGGGNSGYGWHPYCIEVKADVGHYYDGMSNNKFPVKPDYRAPSSAKKAKFEIEPNTNGQSIRFSLTWLDGNNTPVGKAFNEVITMAKTYRWENFLRFASLVPYPSTTAVNDSTYMLGGEFANLKIGSENWGISTAQVSNAWIIDHPKCQLPDGYWATGEQFRIDHWA